MQHATGTFQITMTPEAQADPDQFGAGSARFGLSKRFSGGLEGEASGTMLSVGAPASGASAAYVAIDRFSGSLDGRNGGFVLIHRGTMNKAGEAELEVIIAPDSGTGELEGISGTLQINSSDGGHSYDLAYSMPGKV